VIGDTRGVTAKSHRPANENLDVYATMTYTLGCVAGVAMPRIAHAKHDRMHLRLDAKTKRALERAAAYTETSVSDFVLSNAADAAARVIRERERATLSPIDWDVFYDALINPPEPNDRLRAAARRYRERTGG
jgi:uncharacterized protein (DUF1778 family)